MYVIPCILNSLSNLYFNVSYHISTEKDRCMAVDVNLSMKFLCKKILCGHSSYVGLVLSILDGEHLHRTHHKHPKNIKTGDYDLAYYFIITPLLRMNLIYEK